MLHKLHIQPKQTELQSEFPYSFKHNNSYHISLQHDMIDDKSKGFFAVSDKLHNTNMDFVSQIEYLKKELSKNYGIN